MKKVIPNFCFLFLCSFTVVIQSCYEYKIIPKDVMPATEIESKTVYAYLWGAYEPTITPQQCMGNGITNVRVKTNFGYVLISVITLGTVVPMKIEWQCAKDNCP